MFGVMNIRQDEIKDPLSGKNKKLTLCYSENTEISYRMNFKESQTATERPTSQRFTRLLPSFFSRRSCTGGNGWLGCESLQLPYPWSEGGASLSLSPTDTLGENGAFQFTSFPLALQWRCWRSGDASVGGQRACSAPERTQVQTQPDLDHESLSFRGNHKACLFDTWIFRRELRGC